MTHFLFRPLPVLLFASFLAISGFSTALGEESNSMPSERPDTLTLPVLPEERITEPSLKKQREKPTVAEIGADASKKAVEREKQGGPDWTLFWRALGVIVAAISLLFGLYKWKKSSKHLWQELLIKKKFEKWWQGQDLAKEYEAYRKTLIEEHNKSSIPSSNAFQSFSVTLEDTFVSLRLSDAIQCSGSDGHSEPISDQQQRRILAPQDVLRLAFERGRRLLLIIGDPGAGKTTLLKHYLLSLLNNRQHEAFGFNTPVKVFFIYLRELKKDNNDYQDLTDQLADHSKHSADVISRWLDHDKSLILFDGLDEISDEHDRIKVCQWIDRMVAHNPKAHFVVSSRPTGYRKGDGIELKTVLVRADILGFTKEQQDEFLDKWFKAYYCLKEMRNDEIDEATWLRLQEEKAKEKASGIKAFLNDIKNKTLRELAVLPLLLQIMAMLWKERDKLPGSRVELYESALYYLLGYRDEKRGISPLIPAFDAMKVLAPVALWMQEKIRKEEAEQKEILQKMQEELRVLPDPPDTALFFQHIVDRSGLLVKYVDTSQYRFSHKTFREYLAGFQLKEDRPYECLDKLVGHFGQDWWSEVLRFFLWQVDAKVFNTFMERFFDSSKSESLTQKEQDLLALLVEEAPRKKVNALEQKLLDPETGLNQQLYLLNCLDIIRVQKSGEAAIVDAVRSFIDSKNARDDKVLLRAQEILGVDAVAGKDMHISNVEFGAQYIRINKGDFKYSLSGKTVTVEELYVAKYPVTNKQYKQFIAYLDAGGQTPGLLPVEEYKQALFEIARQNDERGVYLYLQKETNWARLFRTFYDDNKSFVNDDQPVVAVTWYAARAYCLWISMLESEGKEKERYRLPTEIEWEWAAGGRREKPDEVLGVRKYPWADEPEPTTKHANYDENEGATTPVGRYPDGATPEGLYDMAGNVWEWMENWYDKDEDWKALRGGSWYDGPEFLACSARSSGNPDFRHFNIGFRVVRPSPVAKR